MEEYHDIYEKLGSVQEGMKRNSQAITNGFREIKNIIKEHSIKMEHVDKNHEDRIADLERVVGRLTLKLGAILTIISFAVSNLIEYVIHKFFN